MVQKKNMRKAQVRRKTNETNVHVQIELEGSGESTISTGIGFLDHMLDVFARQSLFNLIVKSSGDTHVDHHHTNEDLAIALGMAFSKAISKQGIERFGVAYIPLDDTLVRAVVDLSNRPYFHLSGIRFKNEKRDDYYYTDMEHFFNSFSVHAGCTLHIDVLHGKDKHHIIEAAFKACGRALRYAIEKNKRIKGVLSTKGVL